MPFALKKSWLVLPVLAGLFSGVASTRAQGVAVPPEVSAAVVAMPLVLDQLRSGDLTPAQAWEQGLLSAADLIYAIGQVKSKPDTRLRHALVALLIEHEPQRVATPSSLPTYVKLEAARYLSSMNDARVTGLYQELEQEARNLPPQPTDLPTVSALLNGLAEYSQKRGDLHKALEWLQQDQSYYSQPNAGSLLQEARLYRALGEEAKAQEIYQKVQSSASGWMKGMALYDQASTLIAQGKHEEARKLLNTPIIGQNADQMKIGMLALLGYSYFQTREFEQARRYSKQAITQYGALINPLQGEGLQEIAEAAENRLQMLDTWKDKSFEMPLKNLLATRGDDGVYHARLYIHSLTDQQIVVKFSDAAVQLVVLTQQSRKHTDSGVIVTIYGLAYRVKGHPVSLQAQVSITSKPQEQKSFEIHPQDEDADE